MKESDTSIYTKLTSKSYNIQTYACIRRLYLFKSLCRSYLSSYNQEFQDNYLREIDMIITNKYFYGFLSDHNNYVGNSTFKYINQDLELFYKLLGYITCNSIDAVRIEKERLKEEQILNVLKNSIHKFIHYLRKYKEEKHKLFTETHEIDLKILEIIDLDNLFHQNIIINWEIMRTGIKDILLSEESSLNSQKSYLEKCFLLDIK